MMELPRWHTQTILKQQKQQPKINGKTRDWHLAKGGLGSGEDFLEQIRLARFMEYAFKIDYNSVNILRVLFTTFK